MFWWSKIFCVGEGIEALDCSGSAGANRVHLQNIFLSRFLVHISPHLMLSFLGMLISVFGQTIYRFRKTGLKSIIGFTDLYKNIYYVKQIT